MNINNIEKAELHCHLDGIINPEYLKKLYSNNLEINIDIEEMQKFYPIRNINSWLKYGEYLSQYQHNNGLLLLELLKIHIKKLIKQSVSYIEIMLTSILFQYGNFEKEIELFEIYKKFKKSMSNKITINYLIGIGRTKDRLKIKKKINRIIKLYNLKYINGLSIAGDESACTIEDYKDIFNNLYEKDIPVEIHAGEWLGPESIWDAIRYGKCKRIGHGISAIKDYKLIDYILKKNIHIEICPTSNLILTDYKNINKHPLNEFKKIGINYSINTDDPGHFECTMNSEYELLENKLNFKVNDFLKIYENTMHSAFTN